MRGWLCVCLLSLIFVPHFLALGQTNKTNLFRLPMPQTHLNPASTSELLEAFRTHYRRFETGVHEAVSNSTDAVVLWRLGDDLDQYTRLVTEVSFIDL